MNYIELLNQFWQIRRSKGISSYEADLYYYLLNECNSRMWLNPFELPTSIICAEIGISRKTLVNLRNRLSQRGLIRFKEGNRNETSASYELIHVSQSNMNGNMGGNMNGNMGGNMNGNPIKNKLNKTKLNKIVGESKPSLSKKVSKNQKVFTKPSLEDVETYCRERNNSVSPQKFIDYYESNGWKVGKNPMKDWKAAVRTWEQNEFNNGTKATTAGDQPAEKHYGADAWAAASQA